VAVSGAVAATAGGPAPAQILEPSVVDDCATECGDVIGVTVCAGVLPAASAPIILAKSLMPIFELHASAGFCKNPPIAVDVIIPGPLEPPKAEPIVVGICGDSKEDDEVAAKSTAPLDELRAKAAYGRSASFELHALTGVNGRWTTCAEASDSNGLVPSLIPTGVPTVLNILAGCGCAPNADAAIGIDCSTPFASLGTKKRPGVELR